MKSDSLIFLFSLLLVSLPLANTQACLNHLGSPVDWWVILKVPPKIGKSGFGYYDSTYKSGIFSYIPDHVDEGASGLTMTLLQINSFSLETVAWNDQNPNGTTSSSLAHSKGLISYSYSSKKGFLLSHSIPKYPSFTNHLVNLTISSAQNYYGQHLMCASLALPDLNRLAYRLMITRAFVFENSVKNSAQTNYLFQFASGKDSRISGHFQTQQFTVNSNFLLRSIFKNGYENCSIFQDGLVSYLKQNMTAETWGRPLESAWCSNNWQVNNVKKVGFSFLTWGEQDDHSKWAAVGSQYSCFGDMNRMPSQWKRGGSFFCFDNIYLATALRRTILSQDKCQ